MSFENWDWRNPEWTSNSMSVFTIEYRGTIFIHYFQYIVLLLIISLRHYIYQELEYRYTINESTDSVSIFRVQTFRLLN